MHLPTVLVATAGPAVYLLGSATFHGAVSRRAPWEHGLGGLGFALAGVAVLGMHGSGMILGGAVLAVLVGLAATSLYLILGSAFTALYGLVE